MRYIRFFPAILKMAALVQLSAGADVLPPSLVTGEISSIKGVANTLAEGAMSYYSGTATTFADLPTPYYWWEAGALVGAMLDYSHYTNDSSYDDILTTALSAQVVAPDYDLMVPSHYGDEGNDDQAFWGFSVLSAAERNFPQDADASIPSWLQVGENLWNSMAGRWNTSACGGGLLWQIFASNPNGLNYRNSVSNGGLFQISARLYRATGNQTYMDWANKVWDWSEAVGFIDENYYVYDGADSRDNCTKINPVSFSYAAGIYMYGAAVLANVTTGDTATTWVGRTEGLLNGAKSFFSPYENATNIMFEHACETVGTCNTDMKSFKGYLSRFMYASSLMVPTLETTVQQLLDASSKAAADTCSGGDNSTCGQRWYVGGFDGSVGLGQEMSALETVQGLLARLAPAPLAKGEIKDVRRSAQTTSGTTPQSTTSSVTSSVASTTATSSATSYSTSTNTKRSRSAGVAVYAGGVSWSMLGLVASILMWVFSA